MRQYYYADSSVLTKRHIPEVGSLWIQQEFDAASGNAVVTANLSVVEVLSALNRRLREASISASDYRRFSDEFLMLVRTEYETVGLTNAVLNEAKIMLETHPLRTGDAVQLASALIANRGLQASKLPALTFLASDARLLAAAQSEGLSTDDPLNHP